MITPIIMEAEIEEVGHKIAILEEQKISRVHIDIGDGLFSELLSIAPADLQELDLTKFEIDIHLLVDDPTEWIEECVALKPRRLIGQIERMGSQALFLEGVAGYNVVPGLALEINTPIDAIEPDILNKCGVILLLAVSAGTSGSKFDERIMTKIKELRKIYKGDILIDGGVNPKIYKQVITIGATEVGVNSAWWKGEFNDQG